MVPTDAARTGPRPSGKLVGESRLLKASLLSLTFSRCTSRMARRHRLPIGRCRGLPVPQADHAPWRAIRPLAHGPRGPTGQRTAARPRGCTRGSAGELSHPLWPGGMEVRSGHLVTAPVSVHARRRQVVDGHARRTRTDERPRGQSSIHWWPDTQPGGFVGMPQERDAPAFQGRRALSRVRRSGPGRQVSPDGRLTAGLDRPAWSCHVFSWFVLPA